MTKQEHRQALCKLLDLPDDASDRVIKSAADLVCVEGELKRAQRRLEDLQLSYRFHQIEFNYLSWGGGEA